ncbi:MAG: NTP transferase domain-containing protein [Saprospiraceae bacterium]|nr:NTP transferase domain-containing protein [Saprospiraceae bacterium]
MKSTPARHPEFQTNEPGAISKNAPSPSSGMSGLVLAGGHSRRMGQPKSLLQYQAKPQYQHLADLLSGFCAQVFISCRAEQRGLFEGCTTILDSPVYGDIGPLNGVLSAFDQDKNSAWFVVGCDYPLLEKSDLEQLVQARNPDCLATVFSNPETQFPEPLIGIYEAEAGPLLREWLQLGNESIRRFLERQEVQKIIPLHTECLRSVDTPEEFQHIKSKC